MPDKGSETPESPDRDLPVLGDRYTVTERIGKGGAAGVYLVHDRNLARWRAAKVLHRRYADNQELRARFLREARTMARLDHPNIVRVLDVADVAVPYMIMEYVEGGCVLDWLRMNGAMPPFMAVRVMTDICKALAATHAEGIVHRDVKPHNVLVTAKGVCKLTDFGIARIDPEEVGFGLEEHRTQVGATMGTDAFMSPEQRSDASSVDHRADIYSVGATLFTLCTRKAAVDLCMLAADHPKLEALPEGLRDVVVKACHHKVSERYQRIEELEEALHAVLWTLPSVPASAPGLAQTPRTLPRRPPTELDPEHQRDLRDLMSTEAVTEPEEDSEFTLGGPSEPVSEDAAPTDLGLADDEVPTDVGDLPRATPIPEPSIEVVPEPPPRGPTLPPALMGAMAAALVLLIVVGGGAAAARVGAASVGEARAEAMAARVVYVDAMTRQQHIVATLVEAGAEPAPLEAAFFALDDADDAHRLEAAERYYQAIEAASTQLGSGASIARSTLESLGDTRERWQRAERGWQDAASSVTGSLAVSLGMAPAP